MTELSGSFNHGNGPMRIIRDELFSTIKLWHLLLTVAIATAAFVFNSGQALSQAKQRLEKVDEISHSLETLKKHVTEFDESRWALTQITQALKESNSAIRRIERNQIRIAAKVGAEIETPRE